MVLFYMKPQFFFESVMPPRLLGRNKRDVARGMQKFSPTGSSNPSSWGEIQAVHHTSNTATQTRPQEEQHSFDCTTTSHHDKTTRFDSHWI